MIGADVHPSPTASSGRPIEKSNYPKPGDRPENFIECAQCGFVLDTTTVAGGDSMGAVTQFDANSTIVTLPVPKGAAPISFTDQFADPQVTNGCPLCGSMNFLGKFRDKDFGFNKRNLENL